MFYFFSSIPAEYILQAPQVTMLKKDHKKMFLPIGQLVDSMLGNLLSLLMCRTLYLQYGISYGGINIKHIKSYSANSTKFFSSKISLAFD